MVTIRRMQPRRVIIVAEIITDVPVKELRRANGVSLYVPGADGCTCHAAELEQLQVNVVEPKPATKAKARRK